MSYIYSPPRRRRRGVWILAVASVTVLAVVLVTSFRSERRLLAGYLDAAQESAGQAAASSAEFRQLAEQIGAIDRPQFLTTMARIRGEMGAAAALLDRSEAPDSAIGGHARLQLAYSSWKQALDVVEGAVLGVADDPSDDLAAGLLVEAVVDLVVGDRAYEAAVEELLRLEGEVDIDVPTYPVVVFAPKDGSDGLITAARSSAALTLRQDLAVSAVGFEPRMLSETDDGVGILPFTDRLIVNATLTNLGNEPAAAIPVQVLLSSDRTGTSRTESVTVERLEPAEATSLEFVFEVVPLVDYELVINLGPIAGESNTDNNLFIVPFLVNEER